MRPARDPALDCKRLVRSGYDRCAASYDEARRGDDGDALAPLLSLLPAGSSVLDLGCGAGMPIASTLAERHRVTGVDFSAPMLRRARSAVPAGRFILGEIGTIEFAAGAFDAAVAFYVLFHLPREEHAGVLRRVWKWLRPGGWFLATLTEQAEEPYTEDDFFGTCMYWSSLGWSEYEAILRGIGFEIAGGRIVGHGYGRVKAARDERHPLVLARKP